MNTVPDTYLSETWKRTAWFYGGFLACILVFYFPSFKSMADIWFRSDTFAHGVLIPVIAAWLVYRQRNTLLAVEPGFSAVAALATLGGGLFWLLGNLMNVLVVEQLGAVLLLIFGTISVIGLNAGRTILFPLGFLLLMVPMGEELIEPMMELTATTTVWLVRGVGVPVFREGLYFSLPTGNWSVVEACSGVRYLIASFALGLLYAYITYRSLSRRLLFISFAVLVPIVANSLRAFMIVMIGHHSGMKYAVGVDHLLYGWVFFGIVIFLMFWVGSFFSDIDTDNPTDHNNSESTVNAEKNPVLINSLPTVFLVVICAGLSGLPNWLFTGESQKAEYHWMAPQLDGFLLQESNPSWTWAPSPVQPDMTVNAIYETSGDIIGLYANHYLRQSQGAELVNGLDQWIPQAVKGWRVVEKSTAQLTIGDSSFSIEQAVLASGRETLLAWRWYKVGQRQTSDPYMAKVYETLALFDPEATMSSRYYLATPVVDESSKAKDRLVDFSKLLIPLLNDQKIERIARLDSEATP